MKRFLFMVIAMMAVVGSAFAQKGQSAVGINLGASPCLESGVSVTNFEIGAKYQYGFTDALRAEADFGYGLKSKGRDVLTLSANVHYLFNLGEKINVYPLVGIGYARVSGSGSWAANVGYQDEYGNEHQINVGEGSASGSTNSFLFNVGAGAEYSLTSNISVGVEVKYQYVKDFSRLPISVGVTYRF